MHVAVLRVSASKWDPVAFLRQHDLATDAVWNAGERYAGRLRTDAGFNLSIGDAPSSSELVAQIGNWLRGHRHVLVALERTGVKVQLDVGLTVGEEGRFTSSIAMGPGDLATLAELGVELSFSAYPSSDTHLRHQHGE